MKGKSRAPKGRGGDIVAAAGASQVRITDRVPTDRTAAGNDIILVCPWLAGLPAESALWVSALPIHDANGFVDGDLRLQAPAKVRARLYFGVFALDRLRSTDQLLAGLRSKGIERLINLPSVSFFDGTTAQTFDMLDFNLDREIAFLLRAKHAGFGVALCTRRGSALSQYGIFDFVLVHDGPGRPMELISSTP
jgi:predicted TIM-barrel enzyme